ncbi:VOC family protein [Kineobactrum salinum]|uniref:VOC family protein n=1 Tax=Kineobactrum salinum TaxID=2708301 RepID=A0A6C0U073_9GAMM|nr:VOC family protein [Kineobactrum salinum]QIB65431.1 VOC family protein [Kineobactrum salinum]
MPVYNFGQPDRGVIQTAFITDDIQRSMAQMSTLLQIGPWFLFEDFQLLDLHYRGEPADFQVSLALANSGHMQFELIQPLDDKPSPYRELQTQRGWGFHHYAVAAEDFDAASADYAAQGLEQILSCSVAVGGRAAYFDSRDQVAGMIELVEMTPQVEQLWSMIHQASVGWDGSDPVRTPG